MRHLAATVVSLFALAPMATAQRLIGFDWAYRTLYRLNPFTGSTTTIGTINGTATAPNSLAFASSTNTVYLSDSFRGLFTLDMATGTATPVGAIPSIIVVGITYDGANDTLYATRQGTLYTIDRTTGVPTPVGATGAPGMSLCYVATTNTMYGFYATLTGNFGEQIFNWCVIDVTSGAATVIASYTGTRLGASLAWDAETDTIYAMADNYYSPNYTIDTVDRATGQFTQISNTNNSYLRGPFWLPGTGTYAPIATGCAGTLGVPGNAVVKAANIGHDFVVNGTNLARDAGVMVVGFSTSVFNGIPLPYDLASSGAPGCTAYVSAEFVNLILGWPGSAFATYTTHVPDNPLLVGIHYFAQTYSFDTVNSLGLVAGNAGGGIVGQ
ncbi:MAG TPA: hypothetical protein VFD82_06265 [Planctomycetota bacterium]|nr:hypothetical protein [Planctomycetota bacterium]